MGSLLQPWNGVKHTPDFTHTHTHIHYYWVKYYCLNISWFFCVKIKFACCFFLALTAVKYWRTINQDEGFDLWLDSLSANDWPVYAAVISEDGGGGAGVCGQWVGDQGLRPASVYGVVFVWSLTVVFLTNDVHQHCVVWVSILVTTQRCVSLSCCA